MPWIAQDPQKASLLVIQTILLGANGLANIGLATQSTSNDLDESADFLTG